jgi:hypothetical protein
MHVFSGTDYASFSSTWKEKLVGVIYLISGWIWQMATKYCMYRIILHLSICNKNVDI